MAGWPWIRAVGGLVGWPQYQGGRTADCTILASSSKATRVAAPKFKKSKSSLAGRKHSEVNGNLYKGGCIMKVKVSDAGELNSLMEDEKYWKLREEEDGKH